MVDEKRGLTVLSDVESSTITTKSNLSFCAIDIHQLSKRPSLFQALQMIRNKSKSLFSASRIFSASSFTVLSLHLVRPQLTSLGVFPPNSVITRCSSSRSILKNASQRELKEPKGPPKERHLLTQERPSLH
ncbi:Protein of unknown function [Pyronema omphalodes CBS 100304]|uniref:Uncharacterized protein n=1 Tax=Pyronema omphalodes (strain CBS 100304) TaxID=1076935 RepID=U4LKJ3_PYROM|nr:Protein of unknown function [Pyronema omphalodes CBS 100304]